MNIPTGSDVQLIRLNRERDHVKGQVRVAWAQHSPDMGRLEALHYELKNIEYRISTCGCGAKALSTVGPRSKD